MGSAAGRHGQLMGQAMVQQQVQQQQMLQLQLQQMQQQQQQQQQLQLLQQQQRMAFQLNPGGQAIFDQVMHYAQICDMSEEQLEQVRQALPGRPVEEQLAYLEKLRQAAQMRQLARHQQQQKEEQQREAAASEEKERERAQMEEDGVVLDTDAGAVDLLEAATIEQEQSQPKEMVFAQYMPQKVRYGRQHRDAIVESSSMAAIAPPDPTYEPSLPDSLLKGVRGYPNEAAGHKGHAAEALSAAQLETVVYAGQRHAQSNSDGTRCGFFIGDGTGVGKGRQIAAVIIDNIGRGRYRHIWISISTALYYDCQRDMEDLGRSMVPVHPLHKTAYGEPLTEDGIMFCTYQSLIAKNKNAESRLDQLVEWCARGDDPDAFDGCLVFDEAHRAKNLQVDAARGKGSKTAEAVLEIQRRLRNARILYVSATAAAETKDLGYMTRLGLWGLGTPFKDFEAFSKGIDRAGVGGMELVAMDMKSRGLFVARMLSFSGCSFEKVTCALSEFERTLYDQATSWWEG